MRSNYRADHYIGLYALHYIKSQHKESDPYIQQRIAQMAINIETGHRIRACGARSLNRPSPIERIYRDLSFYVRHDNDDHILAMIGKSLLGQSHDSSFYKP